MIHDREYICTCSLWEGIDLNPIQELVRCKDCKYWNRKNYRCANVPCVVYRMEDDYCSHAERAEE